jgi:hypothetical protein
MHTEAEGVRNGNETFRFDNLSFLNSQKKERKNLNKGYIVLSYRILHNNLETTYEYTVIHFS